MGRAKRPYEGADAYEAGRRDAIKDLCDELMEIDAYLIPNKASIIEYLRQKIYSNNVKGE